MINNMSAPEIVPLIVSFLLGMCVMAFAVFLKAKRNKRSLQKIVPKMAAGQPIVLSGAQSEERVLEHPKLLLRDIAAKCHSL